MHGETTDDIGFGAEVTTEAEFHEALRQLVVTADTNGVDVRGGWHVVRADEPKRWDTEITSMSRPETVHVDDAGSPLAAIVGVVAEREGVDPMDLPPLQDAVDHDLLDAVLASKGDEDEGEDAGQQVRFHYCGYEITVRSDGTILLAD